MAAGLLSAVADVWREDAAPWSEALLAADKRPPLGEAFVSSGSHFLCLTHAEEVMYRRAQLPRSTGGANEAQNADC